MHTKPVRWCTVPLYQRGQNWAAGEIVHQLGSVAHQTIYVSALCQVSTVGYCGRGTLVQHTFIVQGSVRLTRQNVDLLVECQRSAGAPDRHCQRSSAHAVCPVLATHLQWLFGVVGAITIPNQHIQYTRSTPNIHTLILIATPPKYSKPYKCHIRVV